MEYHLKGNFTKPLKFYRDYLPNQTFKFKYLDDAYNTIDKLWKHCQYKHFVVEISFKAIIEDFENEKPLRITRTFGFYSYNPTDSISSKTNDEIIITDWKSIVGEN